jgi:hypothetical protein
MPLPQGRQVALKVCDLGLTGVQLYTRGLREREAGRFVWTKAEVKGEGCALERSKRVYASAAVGRAGPAERKRETHTPVPTSFCSLQALHCAAFSWA